MDTNHNELTSFFTSTLAAAEKPILSICFILVMYFKYLPLIAAFTLSHLSSEFEDVLSTTTETPEQDVFKRYFFTRETVENLNSAVSSVACLNLFMGIMFYSSTIIKVMDSNDWGENATCIWAGFLQGATLMIAARATNRINKFKKWIISRQGFIGGSRICSGGDNLDVNKTLLYHQICDEPIGLTCGSLFTITYGSVGFGLGLLSTYTIIVLQLYSAPSKVSPSTAVFSSYSF